MRSFIVAAWVALVGSFLGAAPAYATKPCPPSPCETSTGQLDRTKCEASADWIAQGTITNVVHHPAGPPLNKDFAEFTFRIEKWEKKMDSVGPEVQFKVGWCDNRQELPTRTKLGSFRVYGLRPDPASSSASRYIFIEPI